MIKIIDYTKKPLTHMGEIAKICYDSNSNPVTVAKDCLTSKHDRILEYANVTIEFDELSARTVREMYTHIIGTTRLQQSTRYVNMEDFKYYIPQTVKNNKEALKIYKETNEVIRKAYMQLIDLKIPKQDVANLLPLGSHTKYVLQINLRALLHMFELRLCNRALKEFRDTMCELKAILSNLDEEWEYIITKYALPKCLIQGKCTEVRSCGLISIKKEQDNN